MKPELSAVVPPCYRALLLSIAVSSVSHAVHSFITMCSTVTHRCLAATNTPPCVSIWNKDAFYDPFVKLTFAREVKKSCRLKISAQSYEWWELMAHTTLTPGSRGDPGDVIQVSPQNKNTEPFQIFDGAKTLMWYKMQPLLWLYFYYCSENIFVAWGWMRPPEYSKNSLLPTVH